MATFGIAALQLELANGDNLASCDAHIRAVKRSFPWVEMVVLPELATWGTSFDHAERMPGPTERHYAKLAAELGIWLLPGTLYERRGNRIYNTCPVIDPRGRVIERYRKMFPWTPYEQGVTPGERFVVFDVPRVGRFGVSICYDGWFPETSRALAWLGAEVIIHPTLTSSIDRDGELALARANAISNQCYFVDVNVAGPLGRARSIVCGPGGEVIHQAGTAFEAIVVDLDLEYVRRCRKSGWQGLGQPLKSFRDSTIKLPCYGADRRSSPTLEKLGPVRMRKPATRGSSRR